MKIIGAVMLVAGVLIGGTAVAIAAYRQGIETGREAAQQTAKDEAMEYYYAQARIDRQTCEIIRDNR